MINHVVMVKVAIATVDHQSHDGNHGLFFLLSGLSRQILRSIYCQFQPVAPFLTHDVIGDRKRGVKIPKSIESIAQKWSRVNWKEVFMSTCIFVCSSSNGLIMIIIILIIWINWYSSNQKTSIETFLLDILFDSLLYSLHSWAPHSVKIFKCIHVL